MEILFLMDFGHGPFNSSRKESNFFSGHVEQSMSIKAMPLEDDSGLGGTCFPYPFPLKANERLVTNLFFIILNQGASTLQ